LNWRRRLPEPIRTRILADAGLGREFVRHVLRHTAATWQTQVGTDPWKAAGFLAMIVETLINTYGHHHPDFQEEAAKAFGGTGLREWPENVAKSLQ
jgi:hypothetical protein